MAVALFLPVWEEPAPCIQPLGVEWLWLCLLQNGWQSPGLLPIWNKTANWEFQFSFNKQGKNKKSTRCSDARAYKNEFQFILVVWRPRQYFQFLSEIWNCFRSPNGCHQIKSRFCMQYSPWGEDCSRNHSRLFHQWAAPAAEPCNSPDLRTYNSPILSSYVVSLWLFHKEHNDNTFRSTFICYLTVKSPPYNKLVDKMYMLPIEIKHTKFLPFQTGIVWLLSAHIATSEISKHLWREGPWYSMHHNMFQPANFQKTFSEQY